MYLLLKGMETDEKVKMFHINMDDHYNQYKIGDC